MSRPIPAAMNGRRHPLSLAAAILLAALVAAAAWWWFDRPVPVPENWSQPLRSVSFAPFRRGESPLTKVYPTPGEIDEDLHALVGRARGVRTYTSLEGMQAVPDFAARLGLKVTYGAWLTSEVKPKGRLANEREIEALIKAANAHPDEIERVIVGNEVLLRGDLKPDRLIAYIRRVKAAVKQPVSYADVWAFYLKYPEVGREVDYITIHILPFWEDEPVAIDDVEPHILEIVGRIRKAFPGKPILIGEAGWPSLGRDRGPAHVSTVNEARFVRKMAMIAAKYDFDYNIVEAFDQPWKAKLENTVGAAWGIMDVDRRLKFGMSGPVVEVADWKLRAVIAVLGGLGAGIFLGSGVGGFKRRLTLALLAQGLSWLAVTTCFHAEAVGFSWWRDAWAPLRGGLAIIMAWRVLERAAALLGRAVAASRCCSGGTLTLLSGVYALAWTVLLVVDGRYRDIPVIDFGVPVAGLVALFLLSGLTRSPGTPLLPALALDGLFPEGGAFSPSFRARLSSWLAWCLPLAALAAVVSEGLAIIGDDFVTYHPSLAERIPLVLKAMVSNADTNLWAAMLLLLAAPFVAAGLSRRHRAGGTQSG